MLSGPLTQILFALRCRRRAGGGFQVHLASKFWAVARQIPLQPPPVQECTECVNQPASRLAIPYASSMGVQARRKQPVRTLMIRYDSLTVDAVIAGEHSTRCRLLTELTSIVA